MPAVLRIALPIPLLQLFDYLPPDGPTVAPGSRVRVPFARGHRIGVVVDHADASPRDTSKLKRVEAVLDDAPLLDLELMQTLGWACDYWLGAPGEVYVGALPVVLRGGQAPPATGTECWALTDAGRVALAAGTRRGRSRTLLTLLADGPRAASGLTAELRGWREAARRLDKAGLVECREVARDDGARTPAAGPALNADQQRAIAAVADAGPGFHPFVLEGVTGSGKTEVYLALMERALARGRQVLMLVPEISLTPQSVRRLRERLGEEVGVLHSGLARGERARAWLRARSGGARVILGTRSAIFTPLPRAGLIVVDEAHDGSYKQHEGFRYHARDLAVVRARALDVPVILGTATPTLETLANIDSGRYTRLHLPQRARAQAPSAIEVVDVRAQRLQHGLSPQLLAAIDATLARDEQVLVFRNRRGYAPVLTCHACGWLAECPRCDKPLTVHSTHGRLVCHHCEYARRLPAACPNCGHAPLNPRGFGTERLEEALAARFADTPVLRIDRETTRRRDVFERMLERLDAGHAAILVGTQMLAKGHDLAHLTLVAITSVDEGLHSVDFRASERLAQLVVQVAGRAGRAEKAGRVLLQTHHPDHPFLRTLLREGYPTVAAQLLDERRQLQLPPYASQALLRAEATQSAHVDAFLAAARAALPDAAALRIHGPMPAPMPRRAGRTRGQLLIETTRRADLQRHLRPWQVQLSGLPNARKVRWSIDVDPIDLY